MSLIPRLALSALVIAGAIAFSAWILISTGRKYIGHRPRRN